MAVSILERDLFSEAEAARLLSVAQGTLHYWLEGGTSVARPTLRRSVRSRGMPDPSRGRSSSRPGY